MKKTKWLAACMVACALLIGCRSGDDDEPDLLGVVEKDGWLMEGNTVRQYLGSEEKVTTPAGATIIGRYAFEGTGVKEVTIGDGVTVIEDRAFSECTSLTEVKYGGTLAQWCQMDNDYGLMYNAKSIKLSDGSDLKSLTTLEIPSDVTKIGNYAFYNCTSLESVEIGDGVTRIGNYAFQNCTSLASVTIPASVKSIGSSAFTRCDRLTEVKYGGT